MPEKSLARDDRQEGQSHDQEADDEQADFLLLKRQQV